MKKMRLNLIVIIALLLCSCAQSPCTPVPERSPSGYEAPSPAVSASPEPSEVALLSPQLKAPGNRRKPYRRKLTAPSPGTGQPYPPSPSRIRSLYPTRRKISRNRPRRLPHPLSALRTSRRIPGSPGRW